MAVFAIDPLSDSRWTELVYRHPNAGVFHSAGWLEALQQTYGYKPVAFTTTPPGEPLCNAIVFSEIDSWITGKRLVSLPFSDHCDFLVDSATAAFEILAFVEKRASETRRRFAEVRDRAGSDALRQLGWEPSTTFTMHSLELTDSLDKLFSSLHRDCIQRKVRRAEKEKLGYESGISEPLLRGFYDLLLRTRRRHSLPPQPFQWFRNLLRRFDHKMTVRVASKDGRPTAALLTLRFRNTTVYKYGCSDERYSSLGGMPFLFWKLIQEAKSEGMQQLDLGRSDMDNDGLIQFKNRLGAQSRVITYWRSSTSRASSVTHSKWVAPFREYVFNYLPDSLLVASGKLLYRHIG